MVYNIEIYREYLKKNREQILKKQKIYREANKEKMKDYRRANKEKIARQDKIYYESNKEKIAERVRKYQQKPEVKARSKNNYLINKFGFIPKIFLKNDLTVTSDGCYFNNSNTIKKYFSKSRTKSGYLYRMIIIPPIFNKITPQTFDGELEFVEEPTHKIQLINLRDNYEIWFKLLCSNEQALSFFDKLIHLNINQLEYFKMDVN